MPMTQRSKMMVETQAQRDRAVQLLEALRQAKMRSENNLSKLNQTDILKKVTGSSSMDNAIASTQRLIDAFNRVLEQLHDELDEADLALLGDLERPAPSVS
ncbi:MAG: hypothetical protein Kow0022_10450 [Phycisphaerales bacterium]